MTTGAYKKTHGISLAQPALFWAEAASAIDWIVDPKNILDRSDEPSRWFTDGTLNTCWNAIDRHVKAGNGAVPAIIYESPVTNVTRIINYAALLNDVARFAGVLKRHGAAKGDRVLIYMPMIPESLVAMLACARIGAVHCTVFGGFAAAEIATRIDHCTPKLIVMASCGIEPKGIIPYMPMIDAALNISRHQPDQVIVFQRNVGPAPLKPGRDTDWTAAVASATQADCVPVQATDPLYILYTSGTTGKPKGVVRDNGGHAVALAWTMSNLFGLAAGSVFWAASDIGWQVGHTYTLYGPLLAGCTTVLFEGKPVGTPDAAAFWRVISRHKISILLAAPTAIRAIRREDRDGDLMAAYDLSCLRAVFLAGERSDPDTLHWLGDRLGVMVVDHWWQTESGWPITGNTLGLEICPVRPGSANLPMPGWDVRALRGDGTPALPGEQGSIAIRLPLPPGALLTLWNANDQFQTTYLAEFPGHYSSGDSGFIDADGYVWVLGRTDDVINVAGHRIATGALEEILASHHEVAECAVIGAADPLKGQVPIGLLVLKNGGTKRADEVVADVVTLVARRIGAVACFRQAVVVERLPKTRSGKILRATIKQIADGQHPTAPAAIDNPDILPEICAALKTIGYAQRMHHGPS